jgi:integrase
MSSDSEIDADAEMWLCYLGMSGRRPATLQSYRACAEHFGVFLAAPLVSATRADALRYVQDLTNTYKPGGVGIRVRSLRAFYGWCCAEGVLDTNPFARLNVTIPKQLKATPTAAEIDAMLRRAAKRRRDLALLTLLADTGCRKGEIAAVERHHIDLRSGVVHFPVSKTEPRTVVLTDRAHRALGMHLRHPKRGMNGLWDSRDPYSLVTAVVRRCSDDKYSPHALRRAFAVRWLASGGSELGLMRAAGWSSRDMIAVYTAANAHQLAQDEMRRLFGISA